MKQQITKYTFKKALALSLTLMSILLAGCNGNTPNTGASTESAPSSAIARTLTNDIQSDSIKPEK